MRGLAVAALLLLCATNAWAEPEPVRIGIMLCQSGACADWGGAALKGAQLAAEQNNASGRRIELVVEDTAESISGARAVTAYLSLRARGIKLFIGPSWAPGALAIAPLVAKDPSVIVITPSASAQAFSRAGPNLFNVRLPEELATRSLARAALNRGAKRAAIFSSQQPAELTQGRIFDDEFKQGGGAVALRLEPDPTIADLRTEALKIVESKPDVVFLMNYNQMENGAKALKQLGYAGMRAAISLDEARVASLGNLLDGVLVAKAAPPAGWFSSAFRARYGEAPGLSAEGGYDAVQLFAKAVSDAKSENAPAVQGRIAAAKLDGATGALRFSPEREVIAAPSLYIVKSGMLEGLRGE